MTMINSTCRIVHSLSFPMVPPIIKMVQTNRCNAKKRFVFVSPKQRDSHSLCSCRYHFWNCIRNVDSILSHFCAIFKFPSGHGASVIHCGTIGASNPYEIQSKTIPEMELYQGCNCSQMDCSSLDVSFHCFVQMVFLSRLAALFPVCSSKGMFIFHKHFNMKSSHGQCSEAQTREMECVGFGQYVFMVGQSCLGWCIGGNEWHSF